MPKERIDKILSSQTGISRSEIRKHIKKKDVYVGGALCTDPSFKTDALNDEIVFLGERIIYREHIYLMLNKPKDCVSAVSDQKDKTVIDLLPDEYKRKGISPCGRLDRDTTGLLILTDDGELIHRLISPSRHVFKTYIAELDRDIDEKMMADAFEKGAQIIDDGEKYICKKAYFRKMSDRTCEIKISEGRFHQIKKMCGSLGYGVVNLKRTAVGELKLDESLPLGGVRELSGSETELLISY